ncbi:MAG: hypothetical protein JXA35_00925 [Deltaproteobacteria bacterium]|nr:hypothetical protein [Deltaproteobacteria bacterium]
MTPCSCGNPAREPSCKIGTLMIRLKPVENPVRIKTTASALKGSFFKVLFSVMIMSVFGSCALFEIKTAPSVPPFSQSEIIQTLSILRQQNRWVQTFFCSGRLEFKDTDYEGDSDILLACSRNPFRLKIEITHSWGRPVMHILIHEKTFHILSFQDKKYSVGNLENPLDWRYFPMALNSDQIFGITRGYPLLQEHFEAVSRKGNQIKLLDSKGRILQVIDFLPESTLPLPYIVSFPHQNLQVSFLNYKNHDDIYYASNVRLNDTRNENTLVLDIKQMVFNKPVSEDFFVLEIPHDFAINQLPGAKE